MSKSADSVRAAWWSVWWHADYSWDGLARKPIGAVDSDASRGSRDEMLSLQDYWRRDPGSGAIRSDAELIAAGELVQDPVVGKPWHIAHVPLYWDENEQRMPAKLGWDAAKRSRLISVLTERVARSRDTEIDGIECNAIGLDERAQLEGVVLLDALELRHLAKGAVNLDCARAYLRHWDGTSCVFGNGANFTAALFDGVVSFQDARFEGWASFWNGIFTGIAHFSSCGFAREVSFWNTTYLSEAAFNAARFKGGARFFHAQFTDHVSFEGASFFGESGGMILFQTAKFSDGANFKSIAFSPDPRGYSACFSGAIFDGAIDFRNCSLRIASAFNNCNLKTKIILDAEHDRLVRRNFFREVLPAIYAASNHDPSTRNRLLAELEGGCRALKQSMGAARDEVMEQRYYRLQLIARYRQVSEGKFERCISMLYGAMSDFGSSLIRPVAALLVLILISALGFMAASSGAADAWSAIRFSLTNVTRPLHVWTSEFQTSVSAACQATSPHPYNAWLGSLYDCDGGLWWLLLQLLCTFQGLLALACYFLFGLAIQRRFHMK